MVVALVAQLVVAFWLASGPRDLAVARDGAPLDVDRALVEFEQDGDDSAGWLLSPDGADEPDAEPADGLDEPTGGVNEDR